MVRVLIVDDEAFLVRNLAGFLESFEGEFEVLTATSAEQALEALASGPVNVLLTDVRLPGMDGIELLRRAFELQSNLKALVMTAFSSAEVRDLAFREGAVRFIEKPLDLDELRFVLQEVTQQAVGWSGQLGGLDLLDLAQLFMLSGKSKTIMVQYRKDRGALHIANGTLRHASTLSLRGPEAFYQMFDWHGATFEPKDQEASTKLEPNIAVPFNHLVLETARLSDELAKIRRHHPGKAACLRLVSPQPIEDELACGLELVTKAIEARPGISAHELEATLPLASIKIFLAVAFLCQRGAVVASAPAAGAPVEPAVEEWRERLFRRHQSGVKVLIAGPGEVVAREMEASVKRLASALDAPAPQVKRDADGPTIVRVRTTGGASVSLTFLPLRRRHRYLAETFATSSDLVLVCPDQGDEELRECRKAIPASVPSREAAPIPGQGWDIVTALRELEESNP